MCLGMSSQNREPRTAGSKQSVNYIKAFMLGELCVAMTKMFVIDIFQGIFELFTLLLLYMAYSQVSFCWCIVYILYCLYQIIFSLVFILTFVQNSQSLFPGGINTAISVLTILLTIFYSVACYFIFNAYREFKSETMNGGVIQGLLPQQNQGQANRQNNYLSYQNPPQQRNQQQNRNVQPFQGQGVSIEIQFSMYFQVKDGDKNYWTHSSLLDEDKQENIKKLHKSLPSVQNTASFLTGYFLLEAVNRIKQFKCLNIYYRAGIVVVPTLLARFLTPTIYWSSNKSDLNRNLIGAPLWEKKYDVPELDKMFYFLDDDKNFEPNLWHHATTVPKKPERIYQLQN